MSWATRRTIIAATQSFLTPRLTDTMVPQVVVGHSDQLAKSRDLWSNFWRAISQRETTRSNCRTIPTGPHRRMYLTLVRSITSFRPFFVFLEKIYAVIFLGLDYIMVTVPSTYGPRELSNSTYPFVSVLNSTSITDPTAGATDTGSGSKSAAPNALPMMSNSLLLLVITVFLLLRPWAGSSNSR